MKNKLIIFCVFLCCFILIFSTMFVYSKYKNSISVESKTDIAEPIFEVIKTSPNEIAVLNNNKYYYEFSIRNFNENDDFSEVKLKYDIEFVLSQENAPVKINLYRINNSTEEKIELDNNKTTQYEYLDFNQTENLYKVEVMYDNTSNILLENNLEIDLNVQSFQEKEENV